MFIDIVFCSFNDISFKNDTSCSCFNSSQEVRKKLSSHPFGLAGMLTVKIKDKITAVKFTYSCIGDDGNIEIICNQNDLDIQIIKNMIVVQIMIKVYRGV